jgi:hypothetical protein
MKTRLGRFNRAIAAILAIVWAVSGISGMVAAYVFGRWILAIAALFALWYGILWARVAARARLLTWREIAMPWRCRL